MSDDQPTPKGNATKDEWVAFAATQPLPAGLDGRAPADLTRDELRELYGASGTSDGPLPTSEEVSAGYRPPASPSVVARPVDISASLAAHTDAPASPATAPIPFTS